MPRCLKGAKMKVITKKFVLYLDELKEHGIEEITIKLRSKNEDKHNKKSR
jgi:hypothetical protein